MIELYKPFFKEDSVKDTFLSVLKSVIDKKKSQVSKVKDTVKAGKKNIDISSKIGDLKALISEVNKRAEKIKEKYRDDKGKLFSLDKIKEINASDASMIERMNTALDKARKKVKDLEKQKKQPQKDKK